MQPLQEKKKVFPEQIENGKSETKKRRYIRLEYSWRVIIAFPNCRASASLARDRRSACLTIDHRFAEGGIVVRL
jgi:hypothetical protein